jgi:hypothetical protein
MNDIQLLDSASNAVIAKHFEREFPGVLIQGDTLKNMLNDLDELKEEISAKNIQEASEITDALRERLIELLTHYEIVLEKNGMSLPYFQKVRNQDTVR